MLLGFRDHTVYKGKQIFLYKRVQILVGDLWAAYGRRSSGLCGFEDIGKLTMFGTSQECFYGDINLA
jgi:hypothetical protein